MQRIHQITAIIFLVFSAAVVIGATKLQYFSTLGPGAGFFPFWLGAVLGVLSLVWLIQVSLPSGRPEDGAFLPERGGIIRTVTIIVSLTVIAGVMDTFGFQLSMFLFLLIMLYFLGRQPIWTALIVSIICSFGIFHLFGSYLDVPFPTSSIEFLANIGL